MTPYEEHIIMGVVGFIGSIMCFACLLKSGHDIANTSWHEDEQEPTIEQVSIKLEKIPQTFQI